MAKRRETTAIVFVDKNWYDSSLRFLIDMPKSGSTTEVHLLQGELKDAGNHIGLWMAGVPTKHVKKGALVEMDYMIPWRFVVGLGLVRESDPRSAGFVSRDVTVS